MVDLVVTVTVRDLIRDDLPACAWSGTATHLAQVARELDRAQRGETDYLAVCPPSNLPVAIGMIDYQAEPGAGTLAQLAVQAAWQSCGLGTILIRAAERRILARGLDRAELGVEECNPRARALYERLGYVAYGRRPEAWDEELPDGSVTRYETVCTLMRKHLPEARGGGRH
jgi:ribosomal protein S18 acetylase RimI-like enzyme